MKEYNTFVDSLKTLNAEYHTCPIIEEWNNDALRALDGLASEKLRNLVPLETRRESGAFFTSTELGQELLTSYNLKFGKKVFFYDPACGAGNLLISVQNYYNSIFSKGTKIEISGTDIHNEFIEATKLRLSIWDLLNTGKSVSDFSNNFRIANGLENNIFYEKATHIITNPPFNVIFPPKEITWASGKVSAAAVFIDSIIENVKVGTQILAILPDVLRSGSRYEKWRENIIKRCMVADLKLLGQFDKYADIDVFSILITKKKLSKKITPFQWSNSSTKTSVVSDLFLVCVGSVVDNRDLHEGISRPYLKSRGLPGWCNISEISHSRQYTGKAIESPFVVIKRTSRHGDHHRAIASIITIPEPIYVDNHLIVLKPISGKIADCRKLLKILQRPSTDNWIDNQIRCRHLTVKVVSNIPI